MLFGFAVLRPCVVAALWMTAAATRPLYALIELYFKISLSLYFLFVYDGGHVIFFSFSCNNCCMSNMINYPISCVFFANNNKTSTEATTLLLFSELSNI